MHRRSVLRWLAVAPAVGSTGCTSSLQGLSDDSPEPGSDADGGAQEPCNEYVYEATAGDEDDAFPWHLHIRNISLSVYSVRIEITDRSGESPEEIVSCNAGSEEHSELVFDLSPDTQYEVRVTLNRPDESEEASTTVSGGQVKRANAALEVTVDRGVGFTIRHVHYDPGVTVTPTPS